MRITRYSIVVIVLVLIVIGFVAYSIHEKRLLEEYERSDRKPGNVTVIATYGKLPEFENEEQKQQWYANLDEVKNRVRSEMPPYLYPEGPVISYGYDDRGYFRVTFEENMVVEEPLMDEIYEMINKEAEGMGIQEVPVIFKLGGLLQSADT